jgi:predicted transposase/invertase (TIGR01784 family)
MNKKLIRFDWAIKKLLRNKANFEVLEGFLSELLFDNIRIQKILESESNQDTEDDKYNRVDILTQNSKNELIIIEIQNTYEIDYFHRMVYGASKTLSENLSLGQPFSEIKKVVSINIVYFDLGQGKDYVYKGTTNFEGLHKKDVLQLSSKQKKTFLKEQVSDIFPEYYIIKVNKFNDKAKDTLDEWIYFLKNSEIRDDFSAKGLAKAKDVLDIMRLNKEQHYSYNRYLDYLHFKASEALSLKAEQEELLEKQLQDAREEERIKAEYNSRKEIAKKAIEKGFDDDTIASLTGLSVVEIQEIRRNMNP